MRTMIELSHLSKSYGACTVINDLTLKIGDGERVAISAASGCGKTTLFRLIAGLEKADSGIIKVEKPVAYIFQEPRLFSDFTVLENVMVVLRGKNRRLRARQWLATVGMEEHLSKYPDEISGGMAQRTVLARALAAEREIFLLDEPFSGLDSESKEQLMSLTKEITAGKTLLLISHDRKEAEVLCQRILTFKKGMILTGGEFFGCGGAYSPDNPDNSEWPNK